MWLLSVLVFKQIVIIDRSINDPCNGRSKIYVINGADKTYMKKKMCMMVTEELYNKTMRLNASSIIWYKNQYFI